MQRFSDKVALVTGAGNGIGKACAIRIAVEYAKRGVRANSVSPGNIETDMVTNVAFPESTDFDLLLARMASLLPAASPAAVAGVVAMLASEDGMHITGEDIRVDGGTLS